MLREVSFYIDDNGDDEALIDRLEAILEPLNIGAFLVQAVTDSAHVDAVLRVTPHTQSLPVGSDSPCDGTCPDGTYCREHGDKVPDHDRKFCVLCLSGEHFS